MDSPMHDTTPHPAQSLFADARKQTAPVNYGHIDKHWGVRGDLDKWFGDIFNQVLMELYDDAKAEEPFLDVIEEFKVFIETNPIVFQGFNMMFKEVPKYLRKDPLEHEQVLDYKTFLRLLNKIIRQPPPFNEHISGLPINVILNWPLATRAGMAMFTHPGVNEHLKRILDDWGLYLRSPDSCSVLTTDDGGWLGKKAMKMMPDFLRTYECNTKTEHWGFTSWDDFFTRRLRPYALDITEEASKDNIITSPCQGIMYRSEACASLTDEFWIKGQPYSLLHMLNNDPLASEFEYGSVYQLYLTPFNYHRWHAPVSGVIKRVVQVPGTYYAAAPSEGFPDADSEALVGSVPYISATATRAIIFIEADCKKIGLMAVMAIGMVEVSTCEVKVVQGARIKKGEEIGSFHFGGSSFAIFLRSQANATLLTKASSKGEGEEGPHVNVNQAILQLD
ncbi:hypothetical protein FKP32DRAFT_897990 [Trametes sanguinea]|nr:hypothetical protein FKP32DRAFT_897990 [Trametes sanguinea]